MRNMNKTCEENKLKTQIIPNMNTNMTVLNVGISKQILYIFDQTYK